MYLESKLKELEVVYWDGDLQIKRRNMTQTALTNIARAVLPTLGLTILWEDIVTFGMKDPIIVINNTIKNYEMAIRNIAKDLILPFDPTRQYLAYSGNQRIALAEWKNFSHISTIEMPDVHWAHAAHLKLQDGAVDCRDKRAL